MELFIGQFVHPVGGDEIQGVDEGFVILASCEHHFIKVHKNLVQHSSNDEIYHFEFHMRFVIMARDNMFIQIICIIYIGIIQ